MTQREKVIKVLKIDAIILTIFSLFVMGTILKNNYLIWGAIAISLFMFIKFILNNRSSDTTNSYMSDDDEPLTSYDLFIDPVKSTIYGNDDIDDD
jgi:C4-dicarboxylate transporter